MQFRTITAQTDDQTAFSAVKVSGLDYIWVIPTETGMLEVSHSENDPHNLAVFNELLQTLRKRPVDTAGWLEVGKLYMAILGHKEVLPITEECDNAGSCGSDDECSVSFSDRPVNERQPYNKWTLVFTGSSHDNPVLTDISRETVQPKK